jgi:hypothetical protein
VPDEERLIHSHVLDSDNSLFAGKIEHPIDQQKRVSVRQNAKNIVDVQRRLSWRGRFIIGMNRISHSSPIKIDDYTVPHASELVNKPRIVIYVTPVKEK